MCEYRGKLLAWLDCELSSEEAAEVEAHVQACKECGNQVAAYCDVSRRFNAYCDATLEAKMPHRMPRWVPALSGVVVAAAVMILAFPRARVEPPPIQPPVHALIATAVSVRDMAPEPAARKRILKRRASKYGTGKTSNWLPSGAAVEIAIPAEAMFPPGAVPEGMNLIAELSIAPDGSVERLRLRPGLLGFDRKGEFKK
jgi:anti-sigma factor RsiW